MELFKGVGVALVTAFAADGTVDAAATASHAAGLFDAGEHLQPRRRLRQLLLGGGRRQLRHLLCDGDDDGGQGGAYRHGVQQLDVLRRDGPDDPPVLWRSGEREHRAGPDALFRLAVGPDPQARRRRRIALGLLG